MSVAVLISGRGSNMHALLDAGLPITTVISNDAKAKGLETAAARGVATRVVEHRRFSSREAFDAALADEIDRVAPRLIVLAGFMRVLTPGFVARYKGRAAGALIALLVASLATLAVPVAVRLYDRLFSVEDPENVPEGRTFLDHLNPHSLEVLQGAHAEPSVGLLRAGARVQFERLGYFCVDTDSRETAIVFNRTVSLRDTWARIAQKQ